MHDAVPRLLLRSAPAMLTRISKVAALATYGLVALLAGFDNIVDSGSNLPYVVHVLSMDTVFENTTLRWRAITSPVAHRVAFGGIVATELTIGALSLWSAALLGRSVRDPDVFNERKRAGVLGLLLGLALWFFGFYAIGGEWFLSWQSTQWNSTGVGLQLTVLILVLLVFLTSRDSEEHP